MLIGEVAKKFQIEPSAIRYYESVGLLPRAEKVNTRRRYTHEVFLRLKIIQTAQSMGFTIREIKTLMQSFDPRTKKADSWKPLAFRKIRELEDLIERAIQMKTLLHKVVKCDCADLDVCEILK